MVIKEFEKYLPESSVSEGREREGRLIGQRQRLRHNIKEVINKSMLEMLRFFIQTRGVKLIFTGSHISLTVAFEGTNVILGLCKCNYSLIVKQELSPATRQKQGAGLDKRRWRAGFGLWALCLPPMIQSISTPSVVCGCNISITLAIVRIVDPTSNLLDQLPLSNKISREAH